jgi:hypothetical protein
MKKSLKLLVVAIILLLGSTLYAQNVADFENLSLDPETHWNGSDGSGSFESGGWTFSNSYDNTYGSWNQWAYTNETDTETYSWENQYSAASGPVYSIEGNYAVSYILSDWLNDYAPIPAVVELNGNEGVIVPGAWICLNAYANLYMADNDYYSENNHYLKLIIKGYLPDAFNYTSIEVYLADYRFQDNDLDFKFQNWQYVSFEWLGAVTQLQFTMESSDSGEYGINTPTYFCMDNFNEGYFMSNIPEMMVEVPDNVYINAGESIDLTVLAAGGIQPFEYQWAASETLSSQTGQTVSVNPVETTTYTVTVSDRAQHESVHEITVTVSPVGVNKIATHSIKMYPLPMQNELHIEDIPYEQFNVLEILDIQGRVLRRANISTDAITLNVRNLPIGIYILSLSGENGVYQDKIIKMN